MRRGAAPPRATRPIRVRALAADDLDGAARLLLASGLVRRAGLARRLARAQATCPSLCLLATTGRKTVGVALGTTNGFHAFLTHIAVTPAARRRGTGRQLHAAFVRRARTAGARAVIVDSRLTAAGFFYRLGYRIPGAVFLVRRL